MADLRTTYMGLELKNPFIVSSSGLTDSVEKVIKAEQAGAGAVILKSLFEEDIANAAQKDGSLDTYATHPEAMEYITHLGMLQHPDAYLELVEQSVKAVNIPVIASLNCYSDEWWLDYAQRIEKMGAHGLELNIALVPVSVKNSTEDVEKQIISIVKKAVKAVNIPVSVKIGSSFSSLPEITNKIRRAGASAIVLFNRFYRPDIDIEKIEFKNGNPLSSEDEYGVVLRWTGILSDLIDCDFSATTGIHTAESAIKLILAGANTVQICSVLYKHGISFLTEMIQQTEEWMDRKEFVKISDFFSLLSMDDDEERKYYQRLQYVKALKGLK
ncbi:dihydroorotate dehydrogenase-like protein [Oceanispirochaeta sp.]|jgi:dihydroorotate dehydrogenase (fumarate)|uniref:dihydroorotate dehydrogenase-like protein n=1 Tax=Oceanispirochaeta sp. TaxID=2035350 RepID=UPI002602455F|nr:dihydroorotate dehydrogenase-like protein [Oceanispirochaeta sp.]MDA3956544.1 dihydroorotate dehydrogenase-like protein [Oceanispirochaeta sp.]